MKVSHEKDPKLKAKDKVILELTPYEAKQLQAILHSFKAMTTEDYYAHKLYQEMNKIHPIQNKKPQLT